MGTSTQNALQASLAAFETAVTTPIVSGELTTWVNELQQTWREASTQALFSIEQLHPRQFEQIAQTDQELLPRIDQLKAEDDAIERQIEETRVMVHRAAQHVPKLEPDEGKAQKHVNSLIDHSLAFVIRVRKQEVAVETWFVEAFNRDRGTGD